MLIKTKAERKIKPRDILIEIPFMGKMVKVPIRGGMDLWIGCLDCGVRSPYFTFAEFPDDPYFTSRLFVDDYGCVIYDEEKQKDLKEHPITYFRWLHQFHQPIGGPTDMRRLPNFIPINKELVETWEAMPMEWGKRILTMDEIIALGLRTFEGGQYAKSFAN